MAVNVTIEWKKRQRLRLRANGFGEVAIDIDQVPEGAGIYVFLRKWRDGEGVNFEALYVGQAENLRRRVGQYFCNNPDSHAQGVIDGVRNESPGTRWLVFGEVKFKQNQGTKGVLKIIEDAFITHYTSLGHPLINRKGIKPKMDTIKSNRRFFREFIPGQLLEKANGAHRKREPRSFSSFIKKFSKRLGII